MCKSAVPMVDIVLLCPFLQAINIHFNSPMSEYRLLWFCLVSTQRCNFNCYAVIFWQNKSVSKSIFSVNMSIFFGNLEGNQRLL